MTFRSILFLGSLILTSFNSTAWATNRIVAGADPAARCNGYNAPVSKCGILRDYALQRGCITPEEHASLTAFGSYPSCIDDPSTPGSYILVAWCACGCFHPDTQIAAIPKGQERASSFAAKDITKVGFNLLNLTAESSIDHPAFQTSAIRIVTVGNEQKALVVINTESGSRLAVTENHPVLLGNGKMVAAKDLKIGDVLVSISRGFTRITEINHEKTNLGVVNFATEAEDLQQHVIIAEGLFVGDMVWQGSLTDLQNRILIRTR